MNKKSFFRGFGVGVLFTAIILGVSFMIRTSDAYVKSRAKELGMVYETKSSDKVLTAKRQVSATPQASSKEKNTPVPKASDVPKSTQQPKETAAPANTASSRPASTPKSSDSSKNSQKEIDMAKEKEKMEKSIRDEEKKLTINAGEWSSDVSKKLERLGVIKSATDFDKYLEEHGYSAGISAGTYKVSKGDTYSQLAKKITGK